MKKNGKIRVRFAPSPTGALHIGNLRTAVFNYLFAKKNKGTFVLRIEDTDRERSQKVFEEDILANLSWLELEWEEGVMADGKEKGLKGHYWQSAREDIYKGFLEKLFEEKKAYVCVCDPAELEAERQYQLSQGMAPKYSGKCRDLNIEEAKKILRENSRTGLVRLKSSGRKIKVNDLIKGEVEFDTSLIGDFGLAKATAGDGKFEFQTLFNFAGPIDDIQMEITHVIRGDDHFPNTPKQILLLEALGYEAPEYGHLPMILGPDRSKLSKRHGAMAVSDYREQGILPEALLNMVVFLGWNPGDEREFFTKEEFVKEFSLERVQKSAAVFNFDRLEFLNGHYIRQKMPLELEELCLPFLEKAGFISRTANGYKTKDGRDVSSEYLQKAIGAYKDRMKKLSEIIEMADFLFTKPQYEKELLLWKKYEFNKILESLEKNFAVLSEIDEREFNASNLEFLLLPEADKIGEGDKGLLLWPLRAALSGKKASAGPFELLDILGKHEALQRIQEAIAKLKV